MEEPQNQPNDQPNPVVAAPTSNPQSMDIFQTPKTPPPEPESVADSPTNGPAVTDPNTSNSVDQAVSSAAPAIQSPPSSEVNEPEPSPLVAQADNTHASRAPVVAIIVAIIIALCLAGLVVFMYLNRKSKQAAETAVTASNNSQTVAPKPLASISDVDSTNQQIDDSLKKIDDTKDFSATNLSDTTLGL